MNYTTEIDTIVLQIDFFNLREKKKTEDEILIYLRNIGLYIKEEMNTYSGYGLMYTAYLNNSILFRITSGSFNTYTSSGFISKSYISIKFAGLKTYSLNKDRRSFHHLINLCSFCNSRNILFKITELDICIDVRCLFKNMLAMCVKKSPKTKYYDIGEEQKFSGQTTYIEKFKTKKKSDTAVLRSYLYDKSHKEDLDFPLTRFELKLQPKFFNKYDFNINSIEKALDRYYLMYFNDVKLKNSKVNAYNNYSVFRKREIKRQKLDNFRLTPDLNYIQYFLFLIRNINHNNYNYFLYFWNLY
ncbi:MAG: hypothetical protein CL623_08170 [Arcobacter sp.]|nr:hypothetical protein [Arcobacter sp.]|tara:strand:- start:21256 stop:22155 length:900 start_codon:yes stop_codon:yes gene_type:complete